MVSTLKKIAHKKSWIPGLSGNIWQNQGCICELNAGQQPGGVALSGRAGSVGWTPSFAQPVWVLMPGVGFAASTLMSHGWGLPSGICLSASQSNSNFQQGLFTHILRSSIEGGGSLSHTSIINIRRLWPREVRWLLPRSHSKLFSGIGQEPRAPNSHPSACYIASHRVVPRLDDGWKSRGWVLVGTISWVRQEGWHVCGWHQGPYPPVEPGIVTMTATALFIARSFREVFRAENKSPALTHGWVLGNWVTLGKLFVPLSLLFPHLLNGDDNNSIYLIGFVWRLSKLIGACIWSHFGHVRLCNTMGHSPPGSSVHGISRQEYWSGLPYPAPGDLPSPGIEAESPVLASGIFTTSATWKPCLPHSKRSINLSGYDDCKVGTGLSVLSALCRLVLSAGIG